MKLIIAEKPDAARKMADFLEATQNCSGFLEGKKYIFTWGFGHLIELATPEEYTQKKSWDIDDLPIIPDVFKLKPVDGKSGQIKTIQQLVTRKDVDLVINACDPDREGELIFRHIWKYIGGTKPVDRLWLNTFTEADVQKAFATTLPIRNYDRLAFAGKGRSEADWLLGMNATRALTLSVNRGTLSLGRVQTATLALICQRTLEHQNFKSQPLWRFMLDCQKDGVDFFLVSDAYFDKAEVEKLLEIARKSPKTVKEISTVRKIENPPLLFDLTALQQAANRTFNMTAAETDETAQKLYQAGLLSYPRTDSRYIGENLFREIPAILRKMGNIPDFSGILAGYPLTNLNSHCVDDAGVTGHHALIITGEITPDKWKNSGQDEKRILALVITRMFQAFAPPCQKDITNISVAAGELALEDSGTVIVVPGWRGIYNTSDDDTDEDTKKLPLMKPGEILDADVSLHEGKTKAPELFTERSLIAAMKNAGDSLDDKNLKKTLNSVEGIGRPATRSGIIETLFTRRYCIREKNHILPTELGFGVYELVKDFKIANPILTAEWEAGLDGIQTGTVRYEDFINECRDYARETVTEILALSGQSQKLNRQDSKQDAATLITCPKCNRQTVKVFTYHSKTDQSTISAIGCRNRECGFVYWNPIICGKRLSPKMLESLVKDGITQPIDGFKSKEGNLFSTRLRLRDDFKVEFS
ncbi:MAG: topoisomerase C-terminal repeat-containing protein [Tannerella sp.]|jgi:DNA topoisomerase-3|nr:topoisomerase C-terminal repeat-containing protein [Tannerella sp.]